MIVKNEQLRTKNIAQAILDNPGAFSIGYRFGEDMFLSDHPEGHLAVLEAFGTAKRPEALDIGVIVGYLATEKTTELVRGQA